MNKTAIKNFAVWARRKLISDITYKAGMIGITENGIADPLPQSTGDLQFFDIGTKNYAEVSGVEIKQRNALVSAIKTKERSSNYKTAFQNVIEEVAYTWFNRLIAVRFMEVNDYLPSRVRVLSSENPAKNEPDFVTTPFDTDLEFTPYEQDRVLQLKDENKLDELFRMLFIKQCNKFNEILPELFEKTDDYSELLLTISFTDKDGVVYHLVHDIAEDDFNVSKEGQVEIIGWMYQYYISEKHDEIINIYKGTVKKDDIPAATQLFTTDWVVRYMVDNSLGRYWIERNPESTLAEKLDFFVTPKDGKINYVNEKVQPQDLTFFDPCMGSGHILVYAFDVLMEIYRECGYSDRDAAMNIVQFNLHGLDIDKRAYQLAYFAVMMKARSYNRRALTQGVWNNVAAIEESNELGSFECPGISIDKEQKKIGEYLFDVFRHAKEIGSLQTVEKKDYKSFAEYLLNLNNGSEQMDLFSSTWITNTVPVILQLVKQASILSKKYAVVCTNPPYMGKYEGHLKDFVLNNYKLYSGDLFSVFMYRNFDFCVRKGYSAFMTPFVWMSIQTYEKLREYIVETKKIVSLIQFEYSAFEEATVPICSFVLQNNFEISDGLYFRLSDFKGGMEVQKIKFLEALFNRNCGWYYESSSDNFKRIPGTPITSYWVSEKVFDAYSSTNLDEIAKPRHGLATSDNARFLRLWFEVDLNKTSLIERCQYNKKWFPMNKGGGFRKWYGNLEWIINYENDGQELKDFAISIYKCSSRTIQNTQFYFKESLTWSALTSGDFSVRWSDEGALFGSGGYSAFVDKDKIAYILALMNSKVNSVFIKIVSPTLNYEVGHIKTIPVVINPHFHSTVDELVENNIALSKQDWDAYETSWDFVEHPFVRISRELWDATAVAATINYYYSETKKVGCPLELSYLLWQGECNERFNKLKANEEAINRIFIDIYGLQAELSPEITDKEVSVRKADLSREIRGFISYAVGCIFGRYSLDVEGLAYAGGTWDSSKYSTFMPDTDNCIPITDEEYFDDDIVGRFVQFVRTVYGAETLEDNLDFIASVLGNKGNTSREVIRNYFLNDFIKDHIKMYQKRPIYWLFDSGKQNGFKGLVYMHRWNADTVGNLRVEYLHRMQRVYEKEIERMQDTIDHTQGRDQTAAQKRKEKLVKQLKEAKDYDAKIAHIALARVDIDLDDGVKVNYEKVQKGQDGKNLGILAKI